MSQHLDSMPSRSEFNNKIADMMRPVISTSTIVIPANSTIETSIDRGEYTRTNGYGLLSHEIILDRATFCLPTLKSIEDTTVTFAFRNLNTTTEINSSCTIVLYFHR